jgi:PAS domain S-box-containing protein
VTATVDPKDRNSDKPATSGTQPAASPPEDITPAAEAVAVSALRRGQDLTCVMERLLQEFGGDDRPVQAARLAHAARTFLAGGPPLRQVVDQLAVGVIVATGEDGAIHYANPAGRRILGWDVPIGLPIGRYADLPLYHPDGSRLRGEELPLAQALRSGRPVRSELLAERADGKRRVVAMAATSLGGETSGAVAVFEDITARRDAERKRERFVLALGHALRNPLSVIKTSTSLLSKQQGSGANSKKTLARIDRAVDRMNRMIAEVLDLSQLEHGRVLRIEPETCDLGEIVAEAADEVRSAEPSGIIEVEHEGDLRGEWDRDRLLHSIVGLLANAVQYSHDGGKVEVRLRGRDPERVHLSVRDYGVGIPRDEQRHLFGPFFRGRNADRVSPGLGLGLFLAAQVARAHGGEMAAESTPGAGSTFHLWLPRQPQVAPPDEPEALLHGEAAPLGTASA